MRNEKLAVEMVISIVLLLIILAMVWVSSFSAGWACGHEPPHQAKNYQDMDSLTLEHGCIHWSRH